MISEDERRSAQVRELATKLANTEFTIRSFANITDSREEEFKKATKEGQLEKIGSIIRELNSIKVPELERKPKRNSVK
jgi:5,10-methenyltetrahydromethanopterin hydrogenase